MHDSEPQTGDPLPPAHVCVQFPLVHVILPHALAPVHCTSHGLLLHVMFAHAPAVHVMSHDSAFVHEIAPQEPGVGQLMSQFQSVGHDMCAARSGDRAGGRREVARAARRSRALPRIESLRVVGRIADDTVALGARPSRIAVALVRTREGGGDAFRRAAPHGAEQGQAEERAEDGWFHQRPPRTSVIPAPTSAGAGVTVTRRF